MSAGLRCFRIPFSTNVERVALAAGHKRLEVEWIDVDPGDRSPVVAASGQELVPVLLDGDEVVTDSPRILAHLERRFPEPALYPRDEARRAEVETFLDWFNLLWKKAPNLINAELARTEPDVARIATLSGRMATALDRFEALLDGRDFLFGDLGVADVTAFPFLKYAALGLPPGDDELFHRVLVEHQPLGDEHPRLDAWVRRVDALPRA